MRFKTQALLTATALLFSAGAGAQSNEALKAAAQKAIGANPEVTARFNAYRAAADAVAAARGGYYPRLDLSASVGRDRDTISTRTPETQSLSRSGAALSLSQLLWDGLATQNEVGRLGHEKLARYFEVLDVTEQTALETTRAYYDVLRYRRLVQLAEDSYVQHKSAFNQIQSRFKAGVGRGVDLEQAGARLALAESNLSTEVANLHDVSARYQRIVGEAPAKSLPLPALFKQGVPTSATEASAEAVRRSAAISASVEMLRSARTLASVRESAYQPKVEARVRSGGGKNFDGVRDQSRDSSAEIVLNWNLFNGGADRARVRQQVNLVNQAADMRDKACRDARQVVAIAYNDTRKLADQLLYLDRNTLAIEKARDAYRQQFDIGQRSLLDLLNSENELYTAKRSYANAEYDLGIAYARTQAAVNRLGVQLGLTRGEGAPEAPAETEQWAIGEDGPTRCPEVAIEMETIDIDALNKRAAGLSPITPATPAVSSVPLATPVASAAPPLPGSPADTTPAGLTVRRLNDWAAAWEAKDVARYMSFYSPGFSSTLGNTNAWKAKRRALVSKKGPITVKVDEIVTNTLAADRVETSFKQTYRSADFNDMGVKTLTWQRISGQWFIVQESNR
ncbi:MAG: hypothetical protein Tsb007_33240 [Rhizobacter sp.]